VNAISALGHDPFYFPDGTPATDLEDRFLGQSAVLICGGPSFLHVDHDRIRNSGLLTMTLNDGIRTYRSDLWLGTHNPRNFDRTIWKDPNVIKVVRSELARHRWVRKGAEAYVFERSKTWNEERMFAPDNTIEWPNFLGSGYQTSMIEALRILFLVGIRTLYLFGVDFHQSEDYGYHYEWKRDKSSIEGNNRLYDNLRHRFELMRPLFDAAGFRVINCNPDSHLEVFEKGPFP